jgi:hypothetical protein
MFTQQQVSQLMPAAGITDIYQSANTTLTKGKHGPSGSTIHL